MADPRTIAILQQRMLDPTTPLDEVRDIADALGALATVEPPRPGAGARTPGAAQAPMPGAPQWMPPVTPTTPAAPPAGRPQADPNIAPINPLMAPPPQMPFGAAPPMGQLPPAPEPSNREQARRLLPQPPPVPAEDPYSNYPMAPPEPAASAPGPAPFGGRNPMPGADPWGQFGDWVGGFFEPGPVRTDPRGIIPPRQLPQVHGTEEGDPYANYPMVPPRPGPPTASTNVFGPGQTGLPAGVPPSQPQPFQQPGAPPMPAPSAGGGGGGADFAGMNVPAAFSFSMPAAEPLTEAATDPDRQRRMDFGDDLMTLGLSILAAADGRSGLGAIGAGGLAMLASQRERRRDREATEAKRYEVDQERQWRREDRELRIAMQNAGFSHDIALEVERQRGMDRRAAMRETEDPGDRQERMEEFYGDTFQSLLTQDRGVAEDGFTPLPSYTVQEASQLAREATRMAFSEDLLAEPPVSAEGMTRDDLVVGRRYLVRDQAGRQIVAVWTEGGFSPETPQ